MEKENYAVYIRISEQKYISGVNSSAFLLDVDGWVQVDKGTGDKYHHAQHHYFHGDLTNPDGTHRYIYDPSLTPAYREATTEELAAERAEIEAARVPPAAETERLDMIQEIIEMRAQLAQLQINGGM